jgi:hypothetical protein
MTKFIEFTAEGRFGADSGHLEGFPNAVVAGLALATPLGRRCRQVPESPGQARRGRVSGVIQTTGNRFLSAALAILTVASQTFYQATSDSFGCTSADDVLKLQEIRSDEKVFRLELLRRIFQGECVQIAKSTFVEGSVYDPHPSMLLLNRSLQPPGYIAPLDDFEFKGSREENR